MATVAIKTMSVDDFIDIPSNPIQRNTEGHARTATSKNGHLTEYSPTHALVSYATDGTNSWKLDGHTRSLLWSKNLLESPSKLHVSVYKVKGEAEAIELYKHFDNAKAVEVATHRIYGAMRYHNIKIKSEPFLNASGLSTGLKTAICALGGEWNKNSVRKLNEIQLVEEFKKECEWLFTVGDCNYQNRKNMLGAGWSGCVTVAAILALRVHGNKALSFFEAFSHGTGEKSKGSYDCVELCTQYIRQQRNEGNLNTVQSAKNSYIILKMFDDWLEGKTHKDLLFLSGYRTLDRNRGLDMLTDWMENRGHKNPKKIRASNYELNLE